MVSFYNFTDCDMMSAVLVMPNLVEYLSEFIGVCGPVLDSVWLVIIKSAQHSLTLLTPSAVLQS